MYKQDRRIRTAHNTLISCVFHAIASFEGIVAYQKMFGKGKK